MTNVMINNWTPASKHIAVVENTGRDTDIEIDWGDAWIFRSFLKAFKSLLLIASAYDVDVDVREIAALDNLEAFEFSNLLDRYESLLNLHPQASNLSVDGSDLLILIEAIDDYMVASDAIRNDFDLNIGAEELVEIDECDYRVEEWMRGILTDIKNSLDGTGNPEVLIVERREQWTFTDDGSSFQIFISDMESNSSDAEYLTIYGGDIVGWSGEIVCITVDGPNVYFKSESYSLPYSEIEFSGTLNTEGDQIVGTYVGWNPGGPISGSFTAVRDFFEDETELINPNPAFFGDIEGPFDVRAFMPAYDECDNPVYGTVGYALGSDPTLGGILLNFDQDDWGLGFSSCFLGESTITGSLSIPNFSEPGTIWIETFRYDGWYNFDPENRIGMQTIYATEFTEGMDYSLDYVPTGYPLVLSAWWDLNSNGVFNQEDVETVPPVFTSQTGLNEQNLVIGVDVSGTVFQSDGITPVDANGITGDSGRSLWFPLDYWKYQRRSC